METTHDTKGTPAFLRRSLSEIRMESPERWCQIKSRKMVVVVVVVHS